MGRNGPLRQEGQGQGRRAERAGRARGASAPGRRRDARAQAEPAVSEAGQGHAGRHRRVLAPARDDAAVRHPAGAGVRHHRRRPRQPGDAEADPRHQDRRGGRHVAGESAAEASAALRRPVREPRRSRRAGRRARDPARQDRDVQGEDRSDQEKDQEGAVLSGGRRRGRHRRHGDPADLRHPRVRIAVPGIRRGPARVHAHGHRSVELRARQGLAHSDGARRRRRRIRSSV